MIEPEFIFSSPDRGKSVDYIRECFAGCPMVRRLGDVFPEHGNITLVTNSEPPADIDFFADWSRHSCDSWLYQVVHEYLRQSPNRIVLVEDIVSTPSDLSGSAREHPSYLNYEGRIFWPIDPLEVSPRSVEETMAWSAAFRKRVIFSTLPSGFTIPRDLTLVSNHVLEQIGSSISRLIVDVYDGGGFMTWERNV